MRREMLARRRFTGARPPAVVLGGLNLLRALGRAGVPVVVATADAGSLALASRYASGWLPLPSDAPPEATVAALLTAGAHLHAAAGRRLPLFYGSDDALKLLYDFGSELAAHFEFRTCPPVLGHALLDKDAAVSILQACGATVPRTFRWDGCGPDTVAGAAAPLLVKPRSKTGWHQSPVFLHLFHGAGKARVFGSGAALLANPEAAALRDQLVVQEYIPGGDDRLLSFHAFADEQGRVLASFCGRKLRTNPPGTGESALIELIHDEELDALGRALVRQLPLPGPCKIDVKRDASNSRLVVMEINARFTLWNYLGAVSGVNLPVIAYGYLVDGCQPGPLRYTTRYRWLDPYNDYQACRELWGEYGVRTWLRQLVARDTVQDVFCWSDPEPFMRLLWHRLLTRVRRWRRSATLLFRSRAGAAS